MISTCVVACCTRSASWTPTAHGSPVKSTSGTVSNTVHTLGRMINSSGDVLSTCLELLDIIYRMYLPLLLLLFATEVSIIGVFTNVYPLFYPFYGAGPILLLALTTDVSPSSRSSLRLDFDLGRLLNRPFAIQLPLSLPSLAPLLALFVSRICFFSVNISASSSPWLLIWLGVNPALSIWFPLSWSLFYGGG